MSEEKTVDTTPEEEEKDEIGLMDFDGVKINIRSTTQKKGKGAGARVLVPEINFNDVAPYSDLIKFVGVENWNKTLWDDIVRKAFFDSSKSSVDANTGLISEDTFKTKVKAWFLPTSRGGSEEKKLKHRRVEVMEELVPMLMKQASGEEFSLEERNHYFELKSEFEDIEAKLEAPSRKGKKPTVKKAA